MSISTEERRKIGKKSRASGIRFETLVRRDLEKKGWVVCKWANNVELKGGGKLIPAKTKWIFTKQGPRPAGLGNGFPDFMAFRKMKMSGVIGVESKMNGILDNVEKEKVEWLLQNDVFDEILVASKSKIRGQIDYNKLKVMKGGKRK